MWDNKYRSSSTSLQPSPTFKEGSAAFENARQQAILTISRDTTLQPTIQAQAIQKLDKGNVITNTIGSGGATNSVTVKLCNGKPCGK